jgi:hypothetical protein
MHMDGPEIQIVPMICAPTGRPIDVEESILLPNKGFGLGILRNRQTCLTHSF